ncbi:gliding motility-associated C-terminal domain-containing protein [Neolewinella antarctica]|uniref:Gliding motility-associated-like protein n=1 Tax=Neolewinella antarctica TaxID=442734 RepID=A0ABX0X9P3_9BACT|nr:gliding motility-associated C-terminal domain-containing protein [Neolewinella antarctica]NJC25533.1 gliding motility-associated-like protein [Neolewinella antarctica]
MQHFITVIYLMLFSGSGLVGTGAELRGQCAGNLGENIFLDGDFGSGVDNVLAINPDIAPGYTYVTNPPPNDGFYTITNNTGGVAWNSRFRTWEAFGDNSSDPNGYMMIVNANFEKGKFYEQSIAGLCDNTTYEFAADVRNVVGPGSAHLLPNVAFAIDGVDRFSTGPIAEDSRWNTYGFSFTTAPGQTDVLLTLTNSAPGGIGNDLALDNITFRACGPEARILGLAQLLEACEGGASPVLEAEIIGNQYPDPALQWQISPDGVDDWRAIPGAVDPVYVTSTVTSGFYYYRYLLAATPANLLNSKCQVFSNTKTVSIQPNSINVLDTICAGLTYVTGANSYNLSGIYEDSLISSLGCDSIVTLGLTVVPDPGLVPEFELTDPSCFDVKDGAVVLLTVAGAADPVRFDLDTLSGQRAFIDLAGGVYDYVVSDRYGCAAAGAVELATPVPFQVDIGPNQTINLGQEVRVSVQSNYDIATYTYDPAAVDCEPSCASLTLRPTETLLLRLGALSPQNCVARDSTLITVLKIRDVYIPTSFSPNGDGFNDVFTVLSDETRVSSVASLRVFDRWGSQVFDGINLTVNDLGNGWDGSVGGQAAPVGVYSYVAEVLYPDGVIKRFTGSLNLLP